MCPDLDYEQEGMIAVPGGRAWYKIYGPSGKPPVLVLHGGPGIPHYYLLPSMQALADSDSRPVILYDQLGCGRSERPDSIFLWTKERYRRELECVVAALGLERFHLWGHSWGSQLALNYAAKQPAGLLSVTLASPILDFPAYRRDLEHLLAGHPVDVREGIRRNPPESARYREALMRFYSIHLHTAQPWPKCWRKAFSDGEFGGASYSAMVGSDELNYTGVLRDVDDSGLLTAVAAPISFICGRADLAIPERCQEYHRRITDSELTIFEKSSHCYFDEQKAEYVAAMRAFLNLHDSRVQV